MASTLSLAIPADRIHAICEKYRVRELGLFGSAARGEEMATSDIDLFVTFEPGFHPGLAWFDFEEELEGAFGRKIDLSRKDLLRPGVLAEAARDALVLHGPGSR